MKIILLFRAALSICFIFSLHAMKEDAPPKYITQEEFNSATLVSLAADVIRQEIGKPDSVIKPELVNMIPKHLHDAVCGFPVKRALKWAALACTKKFDHGSEVRRMAFTSDNIYLISSTLDDVKSWNISEKTYGLLHEKAITVKEGRLHLSSDGRLMVHRVYTSDEETDTPLKIKGIEIVNIPEAEVVYSSSRSGFYWDAAFSPDNSHLLFHDGDKAEIEKIGAQKDTKQFILPEGVAALSGGRVHWSPSGEMILALGHEAACVFDVKTQNQLLTIKEIVYSSSGKGVGFSPDSKKVAAALLNKNYIQIWDIATQTVEKELRCSLLSAKEVIFRNVLFHASKSILVASTYCYPMPRIVVFDLKSGECIRSFPGHSHYLETFTFDHKGKQLATADREGVIKIWSIADASKEKIKKLSLVDQILSRKENKLGTSKTLS